RGPNAPQAAIHLRELRARATAEDADLRGAAESTSLTVAHEAERRAAVRDRLSQWTGIFLDPAAFAGPLAAAPAPVLVPWRLALPWPACERTDAGPDAPKGPRGAARRCAKLLQLDYRAVDEGEAQERQALIEIAVWEDEPGRPIEVTLGGPELFLRLDETVTARGTSPTDPEARLRGAEIAVDLATSAFKDRVSADPACRKTAESDVLRLACNGLELRVLAGITPGDDDRLTIRPLP
ncbi:MAG: hypothetical protein R3F14_37235, partial [Polyangiaceae bacterium]